MIKRSSKKFIEETLSFNVGWNILDIGCGYNANKFANVICDVQDLSSHYPNKKFTKLVEKKLPFSNKEFDFVIASHVMEHVEDVEFFIKELERISKQGYIELPTMLEDNLVFENKKDHLWHMDFDDVESKILISKKIQYFEPVLTVSSIKRLNEIFRKCLVLELFWKDTIDYKIIKSTEKKFDKISILNLLKKYFSKRLRMFFK
ncbi:class I SAM-dependent methyltransferase [Candidatus Pelagibacter sp. Uisw_127]|uniref:class I SAM-dependent methyltransferase n=1 Tax=Candidatus Pelagibacter sp. Uisw_127 TaxID=3230988 RepID=UPI0039EB823E